MSTRTFPFVAFVTAMLLPTVTIRSQDVVPSIGLLEGTHQALNTGPGDQVNARVDCDLAAYTDDQGLYVSVRYFDFNTRTDRAVPTPAFTSRLPDVGGSRIAFTYGEFRDGGFTSDGIAVFDVLTDRYIQIPGGTARTSASIGGSFVAFEDAFKAPWPSIGPCEERRPTSITERSRADRKRGSPSPGFRVFRASPAT